MSLDQGPLLARPCKLTRLQGRFDCAQDGSIGVWHAKRPLRSSFPRPRVHIRALRTQVGGYPDGSWRWWADWRAAWVLNSMSFFVFVDIWRLIFHICSYTSRWSASQDAYEVMRLKLAWICCFNSVLLSLRSEFFLFFFSFFFFFFYYISHDSISQPLIHVKQAEMAEEEACDFVSLGSLESIQALTGSSGHIKASNDVCIEIVSAGTRWNCYSIVKHAISCAAILIFVLVSSSFSVNTLSYHTICNSSAMHAVHMHWRLAALSLHWRQHGDAVVL